VDQAKDALLNLGQLESALARPQNAAAYEGAALSDRRRLCFGASRRTTPFAMATNVQPSSCSFLNLNGFDMTLAEDEIFELAVGIADAHLRVDNVEARLRPAVIPL